MSSFSQSEARELEELEECYVHGGMYECMHARHRAGNTSIPSIQAALSATGQAARQMGLRAVILPVMHYSIKHYPRH